MLSEKTGSPVKNCRLTSREISGAATERDIHYWSSFSGYFIDYSLFKDLVSCND